MCRIFAIIWIIIGLCILIIANPTQSSWKQFNVSELKISISFPNLPVKISSGDRCQDLKTDEYAAYRNGIVYGFKVGYERRFINRLYCEKTKNFDKKSFSNYLDSVKGQQETVEKNINGKKYLQLTVGNKTHLFIDDFPNKRWFEFWIVGANVDKSEFIDFIASLNSDVSTSGIEINDGAEKTNGDEEVQKLEDNAVTTPLILALKPRANYTDVARQNQVQGSVTLRVTFLRNGAIGSVTPVNGLPYGLTEQAIIAANKIVFIPQIKNGDYVTIIKQVQYNFTLY